MAIPTLIEQYTAAQEASRSLWRNSRLMRWSIIAFSVVASAMVMPQVVRNLTVWDHGTIPSVGFRWSAPSVIADRSFSVLKPQHLYEQESNRVLMQSPIVYLPPPRSHRQRVLQSIDSLVYIKNATAQARTHRQRIMQWLDSVLTQHVIVDTLPFTQSSFALLILGNERYGKVLSHQLLARTQFEAALKRFLEQLSIPDSLAVQLVEAARQIPVARFDPLHTAEHQRQALLSVPRTYGIVYAGQTIVARGEIVTELIQARLNSYNAIRSHERTTTQLPMGIMTSLLRSLMFSGILWLYLAFARSDLFGDTRNTAVLAALLILSVLLSWCSTLLDEGIALQLLVTIPAFAMVATLLYDVRLAFAYTLSATLLHAAIRSGDMSSATGLLMASLAGAVSIQTLESRYQLIRSIIFVALGFGVWLVVAVLENELSPTTITAPAIASAINAILSPVFVYLLVYVFDIVLDIPTDLRLLKLDTLSHPLLESLRQIAPGTYQHTLNVAILAENAARAIGANPLLARIGAYFHDIGKLRKPEYFAENQFEVSNKHQHLSPRQSAAMIRSHVEDGVELAIEHKLPSNIIEFIPAHHGTSLISHFYSRALEEAKLSGENVSEDDFRYVGPKPRTKETAIVMLADVAEASTRNAESREEIEHRLHQVFQEKIEDGQLDEAPISLNEIAIIRRLFLGFLLGMRHQRPEYHRSEQ